MTDAFYILKGEERVEVQVGTPVSSNLFDGATVVIPDGFDAGYSRLSMQGVDEIRFKGSARIDTLFTDCPKLVIPKGVIIGSLHIGTSTLSKNEAANVVIKDSECVKRSFQMDMRGDLTLPKAMRLDTFTIGKSAGVYSFTTFRLPEDLTVTTFNFLTTQVRAPFTLPSKLKAERVNIVCSEAFLTHLETPLRSESSISYLNLRIIDPDALGGSNGISRLLSGASLELDDTSMLENAVSETGLAFFKYLNKVEGRKYPTNLKMLIDLENDPEQHMQFGTAYRGDLSKKIPSILSKYPSIKYVEIYVAEDVIE